MPKSRKQRKHNIDAIRQRWSREAASDESSNASMHEFFHENLDDSFDDLDFRHECIIDEIRDVFSFCKEQVNNRFLSVLLYMSLRHLNHSWREIDSFLSKIGGMTAKTAYKWSKILVNQDFDAFIGDDRGGKRIDGFWDSYPDLEIEARQFLVEQCSKKESSFTVDTFAKFIDERFYEMNDTIKNDLTLVRSIDSCRLDLRRFGATYTSNKNRPYFLGHERDDVVEKRKEFVAYFIENKDRFYGITAEKIPCWITPKFSLIVLICK